jgi:hypothetical protein
VRVVEVHGWSVRRDPDADSWQSEILVADRSAAEARRRLRDAGFHRKRHDLRPLRPGDIDEQGRLDALHSGQVLRRLHKDTGWTGWTPIGGGSSASP